MVVKRNHKMIENKEDINIDLAEGDNKYILAKDSNGGISIISDIKGRGY